MTLNHTLVSDQCATNRSTAQASGNQILGISVVGKIDQNGEMCISVYFIENIRVSATGTVKVFWTYSFVTCKLRDALNFVTFHYSKFCCSLLKEKSTKTLSIQSVMSSIQRCV